MLVKFQAEKVYPDGTDIEAISNEIMALVPDATAWVFREARPAVQAADLRPGNRFRIPGQGVFRLVKGAGNFELVSTDTWEVHPMWQSVVNENNTRKTEWLNTAEAFLLP